VRGHGRGGHTSSNLVLVMDHDARLISDRKWPLKKRPVIAQRSKYSFFTINSNALTKRLIFLVDVSPAVFAVSLCALIQFLLPLVGRGITSPCFADGANHLASAMGRHVSGMVLPLNTARCFRGWSKVNAYQLMRQCTPVL
jgi:hypothetical protein